MCPLAELDGARRLEADGSPAIRTFVFPKHAASVVDDWQVVGLPGNDSYSVDGLFVPSAFCFLLQSMRDLWRDLEDAAPLSTDHEMTIRMASTFAIQEALALVDVAYHEAGAILAANPFERRLRDIHSVAQQIQGRRANFELAGQHLLGLPTGPLLF